MKDCVILPTNLEWLEEVEVWPGLSGLGGVGGKEGLVALVLLGGLGLAPVVAVDGVRVELGDAGGHVGAGDDGRGRPSAVANLCKRFLIVAKC